MRGQIHRRRALKSLAAAGAAGAAWPLFKARSAEPRPNIVFIISDDHRYDAFGFMDKPWLKTPSLDRLAREGAHFTNSFVTTSLCSPSRASFLTGRYAHCHGVINNLTPWKDQNVTFLELLHQSGYRTGFIGKWHMPGKGIPDLVGQGKVDRMVSFSIATGQGIYNNCPLIIDGKNAPGRGYITEVLTDYALEFIAQVPAGRPFCLYLAHKAVHDPFDPPPEFEGALKEAPLHELEPNPRGLPSGVILTRLMWQFRRSQQRYYETLMGMDKGIGRVLDYLDQKGLAENTLVIYVGDNGYMWGEHGLLDKRYAYEESIRIPHLLRWPRLLPEGGRKVGEMVLNIDLAPTVLAAAGLAAPGNVQGRSYLGLVQGRPTTPAWRDSFLYEYFADPGFSCPPVKAVRTRDWKFITYPGTRWPDELYHLAEDPGERNDLIADARAAGQKEELKAELSRLTETYQC